MSKATEHKNFSPSDHTNLGQPFPLETFRVIAEAMSPEPKGWQWIGRHLSQRMFDITEARAKAYAERHGGTASQMST